MAGAILVGWIAAPAYFNAVLLCYFFHLFRKYGVVLNPVKAWKLLWPILRAMLLVVFPAFLLGLVVMGLVPSLAFVSISLVVLGIFATAILFHRSLLTEITSPKNWNIAIAIMIVAQLALTVSAII